MSKNNLESLLGYCKMDVSRLSTVSGVPEGRIRLLLGGPCAEGNDPLTIYEKIQLAHALRTSVSMLMGTNFFPLQVAIPCKNIQGHGGNPGFWGDVLVPEPKNGREHFFPITKEEMEACSRNKSRFVFIPCMENTLLLVNKDLTKIGFKKKSGYTWGPLANFDIRSLYVENIEPEQFQQVEANLPVALSEEAGLDIDEETGRCAYEGGTLSLWKANGLVSIFNSEGRFILEEFAPKAFLELAAYICGWKDMDGSTSYMGQDLDEVAFMEFPLLQADRVIAEHLETQ